MRRIVVLAILIVVLATLLNLAIALGFWWFGERPPTPSEKIDSGDFGIVDMRPQEVELWRNRREPDWPDEPRVATRHNYLGVTFRSMLWRESEWSGPIEDAASKITKLDNYSIDVLESGWPLRCVAGERWGEYHRPSGPIQSASGMLVAFGAYWPNRVLWLGMMINELFYVLLIVSTFFSWRYGRRWIRRRRGRCPRCAYDLRGNLGGGCPECGWRRGDGHHACGYSSAAGSD
ncbi:MAG: hypothetical protein IIA64_10795 [Planctomycetes bacterium]|nr:hypothetical protein [Planctomycetota bacterium]